MTVSRFPKASERQAIDPVLLFMRLMWELDHKLQRVSKRMTKRIGLTGPQRSTLRCIGRQPGIAAGEVATVMHLDPGTVTGILKRLEQAKLITREQDEYDGRRIRLKLTHTGRVLNRQNAGTVENAIRRVFATTPASDHAAAGRVLRKLGVELDAAAALDTKR